MFEMYNSEYAIFNSSKFGPTFGNGFDLQICDKSNSSNGSKANINSTYKNAKYRNNSK